MDYIKDYYRAYQGEYSEFMVKTERAMIQGNFRKGASKNYPTPPAKSIGADCSLCGVEFRACFSRHVLPSPVAQHMHVAASFRCSDPLLP